MGRGVSANGRVAVDPAVLHAAVEAVEAELPQGRESALKPTPAAPEPAADVLPAAGPVESPDPSEEVELFALPELGSSQEGSSPQVISLFDAAGERSARSAVRTDPVAEIAIAPEALPELESAETPPPEHSALPQAQAESDEIAVGDVMLSATLFQILMDEADQHLATLAREQEILQFDSHHVPSAEMVRASHTLCGIHRTGGFPLIATTAKSLEQCLIGLAERGAPLPGAAQPILARAIEGLRALVGRVHARASFTASDAVEAAEIQQELETLRQEATPELGLADAEAHAEREAARALHDEEHASEAPVAAAIEVPEASPEHASRLPPVTELRPAASPAAEAVPAAAGDPLAGVHDDVDRDVLPIFLDEAAELFPQAGEELRAWRRQPGNDEHAGKLRRTLHTFKGSARMAGAMRLGELTHLMESRLVVGDALVAATPALFDALDDDLDRIAFVLEALREGKSNVALPWVSPGVFAPEAAPTPETAHDPRRAAGCRAADRGPDVRASTGRRGARRAGGPDAGGPRG